MATGILASLKRARLQAWANIFGQMAPSIPGNLSMTEGRGLANGPRQLVIGTLVISRGTKNVGRVN